MAENKLLPCPFCGGETALNVGKIRFYDGIFPKKYELRVSAEIKCTKCRMSSGEFTACIDIDAETAQTTKSIYETDQVKAMTKRWNRRADNEQSSAGTIR
jgi:hypothetical protein